MTAARTDEDTAIEYLSHDPRDYCRCGSGVASAARYRRPRSSKPAWPRSTAHQAATNAFITVDPQGARAAAAAADAERARGVDRGPLHGIPISLKDLIDQQGLRHVRGITRARDERRGRATRRW